MKVLTVTTPDVENGFGCRVTLWAAGCSHKCPDCHNKHTWNYLQGRDITEPSVYEKVYNETNHDYIAGLTLSGGDPLDQTDESLMELYDFLTRYKKDFPQKTIWIYTGSLYEDLVKNKIIVDIFKLSDVLVDGVFKKRYYHPDIPFRGSTNQRLIDLKKSNLDNIVELDVE